MLYPLEHLLKDPVLLSCSLYVVSDLETLPLPVSIVGFSGRALCGHWDAVLLDNALWSLPLPVGIVGFSGRALCGHRDVVLFDNALVTPTPCQYCGLFWEGFMRPLGCCFIG